MFGVVLIRTKTMEEIIFLYEERSERERERERSVRYARSCWQGIIFSKHPHHTHTTEELWLQKVASTTASG